MVSTKKVCFKDIFLKIFSYFHIIQLLNFRAVVTKYRKSKFKFFAHENMKCNSKAKLKKFITTVRADKTAKNGPKSKIHVLKCCLYVDQLYIKLGVLHWSAAVYLDIK